MVTLLLFGGMLSPFCTLRKLNRSPVLLPFEAARSRLRYVDWRGPTWEGVVGYRLSFPFRLAPLHTPICRNEARGAIT